MQLFQKSSYPVICLLLAIFLILVFIAIFLWPTFYIYDRITLDKYSYPIRINRITGHTQYLYLDGWEDAKPNKPAKILLTKEINKVEILNIEVDKIFNKLIIEIYNNSQWVITSITIRIDFQDYGFTWNRNYECRGLNIYPLSIGKAIFYIDRANALDSTTHILLGNIDPEKQVVNKNNENTATSDLGTSTTHKEVRIITKEELYGREIKYLPKPNYTCKIIEIKGFKE